MTHVNNCYGSLFVNCIMTIKRIKQGVIVCDAITQIIYSEIFSLFISVKESQSLVCLHLHQHSGFKSQQDRSPYLGVLQDGGLRVAVKMT